jgi:hypothetical protein
VLIVQFHLFLEADLALLLAPENCFDLRWRLDILN